VTTPTFDRLRPRTAAGDAGSSLHDSEGKRALFSSNAPEAELPSNGSVSVACSRCAEVTVMSPFAAIRAVIPSLVLSVGIGRRDQESTVGLLRRHHGVLMRCPACGRGSWTRLTVRV
jgi:hypothetical protein